MKKYVSATKFVFVVHFLLFCRCILSLILFLLWHLHCLKEKDVFIFLVIFSPMMVNMLCLLINWSELGNHKYVSTFLEMKYGTSVRVTVFAVVFHFCRFVSGWNFFNTNVAIIVYFFEFFDLKKSVIVY